MYAEQDLITMYKYLSAIFPHKTFKVEAPASTSTSNFTYIHNDKGATITMALAGVSKNRINVVITDVLTVSVDGTAKEKFRLYDDLDFSNVTAEHKDGLLTIKIPPQKKTATSPKVIPIT